jgi:enterochelin esterase-like enzyme
MSQAIRKFMRHLPDKLANRPAGAEDYCTPAKRGPASLDTLAVVRLATHAFTLTSIAFGSLYATLALGSPLRVELAASFDRPVSGRLLLFVEPLERARRDAHGQRIESVDADLSDPKAVAITAAEVTLRPNAAVDIGDSGAAFPQRLSALAPGRYAVQAVLDERHTYAYSGRGAGDLVSPVEILSLPAGGVLRLAETLPDSDPTAPSPDMSDADRAELKHALKHTDRIHFQSATLTRFFRRSTYLRGWVLLPPGYHKHPERRYPAVYYTHGFGDDSGGLLGAATYMDQAMADGRAPPLIWVYLDESSPLGTHEFADSANDGPWGTALTSELIPALEQRYRMQGTARGRLLNGHSSGGWATLWLQTHYPTLFGGTWSTSPDPADFHDFFNANLYVAGENMYHEANGTERPAMRDHDKVQATFREVTLMGAVLGDYGDQIASFEAVFSPRGADGKPLQLFDRKSGAVHPAVAAYWCSHYDITRYLETHWPELKPDLDGKLHVIVGTQDSWYLDGPVRRLQAMLDRLGAKSDFRYLAGRTHNDVYQVGDDEEGLLVEIARQMQATAQPLDAAAAGATDAR